MCEPSIAIKGGADDSVVLCTSNRTYDIRSVTLSNNVLVVCPPTDGVGNSDQIVIQDSLNELLELVPTVPRLHRLNSLLKEHEWEEGHEEDDDIFGAVGIFLFLARELPKCWTQEGLLGEAQSIHGRPSSSGTPGQRAGTRTSAQREARPHLRWQVLSGYIPPAAKLTRRPLRHQTSCAPSPRRTCTRSSSSS